MLEREKRRNKKISVEDCDRMMSLQCHVIILYFLPPYMLRMQYILLHVLSWGDANAHGELKEE